MIALVCRQHFEPQLWLVLKLAPLVITVALHQPRRLDIFMLIPMLLLLMLLRLVVLNRWWLYQQQPYLLARCYRRKNPDECRRKPHRPCCRLSDWQGDERTLKLLCGRSLGWFIDSKRH